jgi:phosphoserine phosphatase RsbU/P
VWTGLAAFSPERFVTLIAALVAPDASQLRYVNAGHPSIALWGGTREPVWLESTGPLVSPVLPASRWEAPIVRIDEGDQLLLYTDGVSEVLADTDGRAEERFRNTIERASAGGASLLDAILTEVQRDLAGRPQPDDLTLLTARVLGHE